MRSPNPLDFFHPSPEVRNNAASYLLRWERRWRWLATLLSGVIALITFLCAFHTFPFDRDIPLSWATCIQSDYGFVVACYGGEDPATLPYFPTVHALSGVFSIAMGWNVRCSLPSHPLYKGLKWKAIKYVKVMKSLCARLF